MSTVYIIGAGASHGESLKQIPNLPAGYPPLHPYSPPLTSGFFDKALLNALSYPQAEQDFGEVIDYIRQTKLVTDAFGEGLWKRLDLEEIFTSLEIEREFHNPESNEGARLLLLKNKLVRYIRRILGFCTQYTYGEFYEKLAQSLHNHADDSVITFNWDLLLDRQFINGNTSVTAQYSNFLWKLRRQNDGPFLFPVTGSGLFLKLHGSLNWFRCGNYKCQAGNTFTFIPDTQGCLSVHEGIGEATCWGCGSEMNPIIIPPLLRKPITEDPVIRSGWGLARERLIVASRVVVIGFSAAPTDFYTSWLLRSTVGTRGDVEVIVINPDNGDSAGHHEFKRRMDSIFPRSYSSDLREFSEIDSVLSPH